MLNPPSLPLNYYPRNESTFSIVNLLFLRFEFGHPLDGLNALQKVTFVMKAGQPINRDTL